jgi:hypothetical protein
MTSKRTTAAQAQVRPNPDLTHILNNYLAQFRAAKGSQS